MPGIPEIIFPLGLDSDYTLFNVHNSTQSILAANLSAKDNKIQIVPRNSNDPDCWPANGFITIKNEVIYYDDVERNENGKVFKLLKCLRGVESKARDYSKSTPVFGFVMAQHHNQLVDAILRIEETIGDINEMFEMRMQNNTFALTQATEPLGFESSLHKSMASLMGCAPVGDDTCPDVEFEFNLISATEGEFCLRIFGTYTSFSIDFGDGNTTTTQFSGTHTYGGGGPFNPTVTVTAPNCVIVQQPTTPDEACDAPTLPTTAVPFNVVIPTVPDFPQFVTPTQSCPGPLFNLPPIIFPEFNPCDFIPTIILPSVAISLDIPPITVNILSDISIVGCCMPSEISIIGCCDIPSEISLICASATPSCTNPVASMAPQYFSAAIDENALADLGIPDKIDLDIPDIKLIAPEPIKLDVSGLPKSIPLEFSTIKVEGIPDIIKVDMPRTIEILHNIPTVIEVKMPENPVFELKYPSAPLDVNINLTIDKALGEIVAERK